MLKKTALFTAIVLVSIQFIGVERTNPEVDEQLALKAPDDVMSILKKGCYDCHSNETKWPLYSNIAPISFVVASHVKKARKALNFSTWASIEKDIKEKRLKRAVMTVNNGMMALPSYRYAHEKAKLSKDEKTTLTTWFEKEIDSL